MGDRSGDPSGGFVAATYNIHHGAPPGRGYRRGELLAAVGSLDVDVLALQEVDRRVRRSRFADQTALIADRLGLGSAFAPARRIGWFGAYGVSLATRFPMRAQQVVPLPAQGQEARVALVVTVDTPLGPVTVCATHLQHRRPDSDVQLDFLLEQLARRASPTLLLGDLNLGPEDASGRFRDHGYVVAEGEPTFPTRAARKRIDWIAARGLEVGVGSVPRVWASDHFPLLARVS